MPTGKFAIRALDIGKLHFSIVHNSTFTPKKKVGGFFDILNGELFSCIRIGTWYINLDWC